MQLCAFAPVIVGLEAFSILGRIGGDATDLPCSQPGRRVSLSVSSVGSEAMQLPVGHHHVFKVADLSVSSVGSEAMQPWLRRGATPDQCTFSILGRIGGDATQPHPQWKSRQPPLSVSSVGSEAMQQFCGNKGYLLYQKLSVSSVGSEAMQHWFVAVCTIGVIFSFQYPRSDRRRCNAVQDQLEPLQGPDFQYPRSDRRRCNSWRWFWPSGTCAAFSILGRIGGDATRPWGHPEAASALPAFSILGRIGGDATRWMTVQAVTRYTLSVSSVGSEAMQPVPDSDPGRRDSPFQYPRSDRRRCNSFDQSIRYLKPSVFQYPRSDRRRCNDSQRRQNRSGPNLSVSSVGSEAMQLTAFAFYGYKLDIAFQYPRSDRRRCNTIFPNLSHSAQAPFSILGRIGGDATIHSM